MKNLRRKKEGRKEERSRKEGRKGKRERGKEMERNDSLQKSESHLTHFTPLTGMSTQSLLTRTAAGKAVGANE